MHSIHRARRVCGYAPARPRARAPARAANRSARDPTPPTPRPASAPAPPPAWAPAARRPAGRGRRRAALRTRDRLRRYRPARSVPRCSHARSITQSSSSSISSRAGSAVRVPRARSNSHGLPSEPRAIKTPAAPVCSNAAQPYLPSAALLRSGPGPIAPAPASVRARSRALHCAAARRFGDGCRCPRPRPRRPAGGPLPRRWPPLAGGRSEA